MDNNASSAYEIWITPHALTPLLLRNAGGLANGVPPLVFIRHEFPELFCRRAPDHHADRHQAFAHLLVGNGFR
jgi:hypothetical protein